MSKVIVISGASKGIGLSIAKKCLMEGAIVFGFGTSAPTTPSIDNLLQNYPTFTYISTDLAQEGSGASAVQQCIAKYGKVDAIVHNAGVLAPVGTFSEIDLNEWRKLMQINFFAGMEMIQAGINSLRENNGTAILVSSGASTKPYPTWMPYCVSKVSLNTAASILALEEPKVAVIAVRPGVVDTPMQEQIRGTLSGSIDPTIVDKLKTIKESNDILHPDQPGFAIAELALRPRLDLSGQYIEWNSISLA
ncbi:hypothetical protein BC833DRAFT_587128 [Globomyces pollinis-pini]|nr:hypothetical protein BC833DRAFT_587128 [Globomyces pollinis-pini]